MKTARYSDVQIMAIVKQAEGGMPLAEQARQIMQAVADAKLDADTARILIGCLNAVAGIEAIAELESRLTLLEAKAVN